MSKTEAVAAIAKLLNQMKTSEVTDKEMDLVIKLAIKEDVLEALLDSLTEMIDNLRPPKIS